MAKVRARYYTTLRELAETPEERITLSNRATLADLIETVASKYGEEARNYLYKKGKIDPSIYFLINGKDSRVFSGLKTKLNDGDIAAIIPPIGGGSEKNNLREQFYLFLGSAFNANKLQYASTCSVPNCFHPCSQSSFFSFFSLMNSPPIFY